MNSDTNQKNDAQRRRSSGRDRRSQRRKAGFWEAKVDQSLSERSRHESESPEPPHASQSRDGLTSEKSEQSAAHNESEVCPVSKSIEAVLASKTNARRQRAKELEQVGKYQEETRRPIVSLFFILPFLLVYEIGSILIGHQAIRSGIDQWFHQPFYQLGMGGVFVLPIITIAALLAWHHQKQDHWRVRPRVLLGMLAETAGLGLILFWAANAICQLIQASPPGVIANSFQTDWLGERLWSSGLLTNAVACVGSGIYEELIFRIGCLTGMVYAVRQVVEDKKISAGIGIVVVSLVFAALHYSFLNPSGNPFDLSSFAFRAFASIVFCFLFLFRGFGIAVGTHVAYDVLTQL